jgi:hypothetical protein
MNDKRSLRLFPVATISVVALAFAFGCTNNVTDGPAARGGAGAAGGVAGSGGVTGGSGGVTGGSGGTTGGSGGTTGATGGATGGSGGTTGGSGGVSGGSGGATGGSGGTSGATGGMTGGSGGTSGATGGTGGTGGTPADSGTGGKAGDSGTTPLPDARGDVDLTGRTPARCAAPITPIYGWKGGKVGSVAGDCDKQTRSIDFEPVGTDSTTYPSPTTPYTITDTGNAFGAAQVSNCRVYCFNQGLLIGVDFVNDGNPKNLVGEVIMDFPTVATATNPDIAPFADVRALNYLGWFHFDRPVDGAQPLPGGTISVNTVVKTTTGIVLSDPVVWQLDGSWAVNADSPLYPVDGAPPPKTGWNEVKYFPITNGFKTVPADQAKLVNVTGIGYRFTWKNPPAGGQWHNILAIDHVQIRP